MLRKSKIIVLCRFSASGKDSLQKEIKYNSGFHVVVSHTTRPIRDGESNGVSYNFISNKEFLEMNSIGRFIDYRRYDTLVDGVPGIWHYGVEKSQVVDNINNVVVLDIVGLIDFKKFFGDRCISFFLNSPVEERRNRCIKRGDYDETEFNRRYEDDLKKFSLVEKVVDYMIESTDAYSNPKEIIGVIKSIEESEKREDA